MSWGDFWKLLYAFSFSKKKKKKSLAVIEGKVHVCVFSTGPHRLYIDNTTNVRSVTWQNLCLLITPLLAILGGLRCWKTAQYLIPWCFWCGWSSDYMAPTTTCYPPWESRTQAALVRSYRLSYWLTKPRVSRKNKHEQRLQCMGQSAGSSSIWPCWSYSHARLSSPFCYHLSSF